MDPLDPPISIVLALWVPVPSSHGLSLVQGPDGVHDVIGAPADDGGAERVDLERWLTGARPLSRVTAVLPTAGSGTWGIEVVTKPEGDEEERLRFDEHHVADYTWRIAQALEQRYGFPYGIRTNNDGFLMRLFQVGDHGVKVTSGFSKVEVEIDSFRTLLENSYGRY